MMAEARRRLAAIMAADVAGYSRLMGDDEEATIAALDASRDVFRNGVATHNGHVVDTVGDSVLATFESVVEAVRCATEIQATLAKRNAELPNDRRMQFRIGVNLGDVIEKVDGTIYGDGVNVAARLESLAVPGGIIVSESAHLQVRSKFDFQFEDLGSIEVKNISDPVRAYRLRMGNMESAIESEPILKLPDKPSVAVLPFDNLGGDPEQEYFADGIAEDLITALSRIRWLFVTARNSTFAYKGQSPDLRQVGEDLGVRYVLEGSVRKGGSRIRINAQLVEAASGNHVWAQRYDRELEDVFELQDEITETLAIELVPELDAVERNRARRKPPNNLDAWESYQRGLWHLSQYNFEDNAQAKHFFERAIALDPTFSPSHGALAYAVTLDYLFGETQSREQSLSSAFRLARKAIALDDRDAMAHTALGRALMVAGDYEGAIAEVKVALNLSPNLAWAHYGAGHALLYAALPEDAIPEFEEAIRLSPHDPIIWLFDAMLALSHLHLQQWNSAIEIASRGARRASAGIWVFAVLAAALAEENRIDEAKRAIGHLLELKPDFSSTDIDKFAPWRDRDFVERWTNGLHKAGLEPSDGMA